MQPRSQDLSNEVIVKDSKKSNSIVNVFVKYWFNNDLLSQRIVICDRVNYLEQYPSQKQRACVHENSKIDYILLLKANVLLV